MVNKYRIKTFSICCRELECTPSVLWETLSILRGLLNRSCTLNRPHIETSGQRNIVMLEMPFAHEKSGLFVGRLTFARHVHPETVTLGTINKADITLSNASNSLRDKYFSKRAP
jgi:hypothetical protein